MSTRCGRSYLGEIGDSSVVQVLVLTNALKGGGWTTKLFKREKSSRVREVISETLKKIGVSHLNSGDVTDASAK